MNIAQINTRAIKPLAEIDFLRYEKIPTAKQKMISADIMISFEAMVKDIYFELHEANFIK